MVRTAGVTGGVVRPITNAIAVTIASGSMVSAMRASSEAQIAVVTVSTWRMPSRPMSRLVNGPAMAWPTL